MKLIKLSLVMSKSVKQILKKHENQKIKVLELPRDSGKTTGAIDYLIDKAIQKPSLLDRVLIKLKIVKKSVNPFKCLFVTNGEKESNRLYELTKDMLKERNIQFSYNETLNFIYTNNPDVNFCFAHGELMRLVNPSDIMIIDEIDLIENGESILSQIPEGCNVSIIGTPQATESTMLKIKQERPFIPYYKYNIDNSLSNFLTYCIDLLLFN